MGTCYSKSGHDAAEGNSKNQPLSKESGRHQPNGSLYVYRPGKDHSSSQPASASQSGNVGSQDKGEEVLKINTIDSGIESLTSSQCNKELKELAENSELREATDTFELIDNGPCACGENCDVNGQCKFECLSKLPESNVEWTSGHGRPLSQPARKCIESSIPLIHRKSRCKGRIERKSSRLSWKSTDSLDWTRTMVTTMDRTTSQVSDIFVDDISLHAPLAHFDSIEFSGEDKDSDANGAPKACLKTVVAVTANSSEIESSTCSTTILISNDKPASEKRAENVESTSVQSTDRTSKDINIEEIVKKQLSSQSLLGSREGESSSLAGSLLNFPPKSEVTSVVVDGKEVVLIDADTYSQVMDEIALLKTKLGQLTSVIQTESLNYCDPANIQSTAWLTGTMDTSYSYDQNIGGAPAVLGSVGEQLIDNTSSSSTEQKGSDFTSSTPHVVADPSSSSEKCPADVSLLAEKLVAEVLPASAAQLAMMAPIPQDVENSPTDILDPPPPECAQEQIDSLSAPTSSEGQTLAADPSTNADNTSSKT